MQEPETLTVFANAKVRNHPNLSSGVIGSLSEGQHVLAICGAGPDGDWCMVSMKGGLTPENPFNGKLLVLGSYGYVWAGCLGKGSECR